MFDRILIANRGEIACRVIRTARRLGIATVAVYSDADADALHVAMADEAVRLGPAPAAESYLVAERVLAAAADTGAQAIHPGYGFLSENAAFADACAAAGIAFIGPPAAAIRAMGSKSAAKALMVEAGVSVVPGYHGEDQDPDRLAAVAEEIGYPVLVKASAGGGGKGMRLVAEPSAFAGALNGAKREAAASFGDDHVLIEKFVDRPRHIEIQVFADGHGDAVYLFERDCSVQRRHQKVLEEAPAPGLAPEKRAEMGAAAVAAAKAIGYVGAGTVEFISSGGTDFYFMEMNTRLQVEHPVTEMITGEDLVEWQLRVAAGQPLPKSQDRLTISGHAIEARIYAEDPSKGFLPAAGRLAHLAFPENDPAGPIRVDTGVRPGDTVSPFYDPMIAKLIVHGADRREALRRLDRALAACEVAGPATNVGFLRRAVTHPAFTQGGVDTGFIAANEADLLPPAKVGDRALALASLAILLERAEAAREAADVSGDPYSPWHLSGGWRMNDEAHNDLRFEAGDETVDVRVHYRRDGYVLDLPGGSTIASVEPLSDGRFVAVLDGRRAEARVVRIGDVLTLFDGGRRTDITHIDPLAGIDALAEGKNELNAPMSGKIIQVMTDDGAEVEAGAPLLVLEAMKMEHTIHAPADGTVSSVLFSVGDQVEEGALLVAFEAKEA